MKRHSGCMRLLPLLAGLVAAVVLFAGFTPAFAQGNTQAMAMYRLYNP